VREEDFFFFCNVSLTVCVYLFMSAQENELYATSQCKWFTAEKKKKVVCIYIYIKYTSFMMVIYTYIYVRHFLYIYTHY
jgi:hypothetical protein